VKDQTVLGAVLAQDPPSWSFRGKLLALLKEHDACDLNLTYHNGRFYFFSDRFWYLPAGTLDSALQSIKKHQLQEVKS